MQETIQRKDMRQKEMAQASEAVRLVAQWPGSWLLDADGTVMAHGPLPPALVRHVPADARGTLFFGQIVPVEQTQDLAGTFAVAMEDPETTLDFDQALRLSWGEVGVDLRVRLRRLEGLGAAAALVVLEDDTPRKTAERALAAALGEGTEDILRDAETGLFGLRQFEFLLPIELRRGQRYGTQTSLLGLQPQVQVKGQWTEELDGQLLQELGDRVQTALRQTDVVFRLKPRRLHVVLTHTDSDGATVAAQRVHSALAQGPLPRGHVVRVRAALVASGTPERSPPAPQWARQMLAEVDALLTAG